MSTRDRFRELTDRLGGTTSHFVQQSRQFYSYAIFLAVFLLVGAPLVYYVWGSFWSTAPGMGGGFTLNGYAELFRPRVYQTLSNTFQIAVLGTIIALAFGITGMFFAIKTDTKFRTVITLLFVIQYLMPSYISALAWQFWAGRQGALNQVLMFLFGLQDPPLNIYSVGGIALVGGAHYAGLIYLLASGAVRAVPASLEETSRLAGASIFQTFRRITLPLALPSLAIATVLVFARLIQSFGIPLILGIPGEVFVVATHMYYALTQTPPAFNFASAMGMIILVVSMAGLILQRRVSGEETQYETVGGQGGGTGTMKFDLGSKRYLLLVPFLLAVTVIYLMPYISLGFNSFQANYAGLNVFEAKWTLSNYTTLLIGTRSNQFLTAVFNTVIMAGVGAFLGMMVSSFASYVIVKSDSSISGLLDFLTLSPAAMPGIIVGTAFLWIWLTYNIAGLYGTIWIIMLALTARFIVYGVRATNSSLRSIDTQLEEAARMSGGGFLHILKDIYLPLMKPGFAAGYVLLFVDYMKVLTIPLLLQSTGNQVLSVVVWELGAVGYDQVAAAVAMMLISLVSAIYIIAERYTSYNLTEL